MQSKAKTVAQYLRELPPERREALSAVRKVILENLPQGFEECMNCGVIGYVVPKREYPAGYHCDPSQPLPFASLASQKNYMSLYLMTVYGGLEDWFRAEYQKTGKKLDMGKCCVRFKRLDDLPLELIGRTIARVSLADYIARYESVLARASARAGTKNPVEKHRPARRPKAHAKPR